MKGKLRSERARVINIERSQKRGALSVHVETTHLSRGDWFFKGSSKKKKQVFSKNRQLPLSRDFSPGGGYKESNNSSKDRLDIARGANTRRYASHVFGGERDKLGPIRLAASRGAVKENHFTPGYTPFHPCENSRSFRVSLASHPSLAVYLPPFFFFFLPTFSRLSFPIHPRFPAPRYAMLVCLDENLEKKKKGGEE